MIETKMTVPEKDAKRRVGRRRGPGGFTLVEVLMAMTILTIGLLGVAKMQISAIHGNYTSSTTTVALTLAEQKMESLMSTSYSDASLNNTDTANDAALSSVTTVDHEEQNVRETGQVGGGIYHRIWNIADHPSGTENLPTMKEVTVIVTWDNDRHRVSLSSIRPQ